MFRFIVLFFSFVLFFSNYFEIYNNSRLVFSSTKVLSLDLDGVRCIDWKTAILNMLSDVFFFNNFIIKDSVVLVNIIKNNTNGVLQSIKITGVIIDVIKENTDQYRVIDLDELYYVYRELEISPEDVINSYEFSIRIANYLKADYVIYGLAYGDSQLPNLELQLILSNTYEILKIINNSSTNHI